MKRIVIVSLFVLAAAAWAASDEGSGKTAPAAGGQHAMDLERFKMAMTDERRKLFSAAMSNLTAEQLGTFWSVYADFQEEKDEITSARMDLAKEYIDTFNGATGLDDAAAAKIVNEMGALQKKNVDLRLKYFSIYSEKIDPKAAARFALVDDYITTAWRLDLLDQIPLPGDAVKAN